MTSRTLGMLMAASLASFAWAEDDPTGTYSALVDLGNDPAQLCVTFDARGYATGTVIHQRQRHAVRGSLSDLRVSSNGRHEPLRMIRPQGGEANGFLTLGDRTAAFAAGRRSAGNIFAGRYTLIAPAINVKPPPAEEPTASAKSRSRLEVQFPGGTTVPSEAEESPAPLRLRPKYLGGHGYGIMTITPAGYVRITMRLADGQHFSIGQHFSAPLSLSFVAAPNLSGSFSGKLKFIEIEDSSDADGVFRWVRDDIDGRAPLFRYGFNVQERLMASRYKPDQIPLKGDTEPRGRLAIKGGILTRNSATAVYFDDGELDAPEYHFKSRLNQFSGAFASPLILPVYEVPARTGGVVFQKQNRIYGMSETSYGTSGVNIERKNEHLKD